MTFEIHMEPTWSPQYDLGVGYTWLHHIAGGVRNAKHTSYQDDLGHYGIDPIEPKVSDPQDML